MADRKKRLTQAIGESVGAEKLTGLFDDKQPEPAAPKKSRKKPVVPGAPHKRAAYDQSKRSAEMNVGVQEALKTRARDEIDRKANELINTHTREVMQAKKLHPDNQAIQELEPISRADARDQVASDMAKGTGA